MSPQTTQLVIRRFGPRSNRFSRRFERRCGMRQSTVEVFMSPIRAKFADLRKLGKPLWGAAFIKQEAIIHPHDLEKSPYFFARHSTSEIPASSSRDPLMTNRASPLLFPCNLYM